MLSQTRYTHSHDRFNIGLKKNDDNTHDWYTGRWCVGCYIWYSEEGPERAGAPPSPLLAVPNVAAHPSTTSVPTSYYLMWHSKTLHLTTAAKSHKTSQILRASVHDLSTSYCIIIAMMNIHVIEMNIHNYSIMNIHFIEMLTQTAAFHRRNYRSTPYKQKHPLLFCYITSTTRNHEFEWKHQLIWRINSDYSF